MDIYAAAVRISDVYKRQGMKRVERFDRTHKLVEFKVGDMVLIRSNPVGKRIDNTAKKFFRLYEGPYVLQTRRGAQTFMVYDIERQKEEMCIRDSSLVFPQIQLR